MKDIIYQLEAVKTKCIWENMKFDAEVLEDCIRRLNEIEDEHSNIMTRLVDQNTLFGAKMKVLQDKLEKAGKERDATIAINVMAINPKPTDIIVLRFDDIKKDEAQYCFDCIQKKFPNNTVVPLPKPVDLEVASKELWEDYIKMIYETINTMSQNDF